MKDGFNDHWEIMQPTFINLKDRVSIEVLGKILCHMITNAFLIVQWSVEFSELYM